MGAKFKSHCLEAFWSPLVSPGLPEAVPLLASQSVIERAPGVTGLGACGVKGGAYTEASPVLRVTLLPTVSFLLLSTSFLLPPPPTPQPCCGGLCVRC